MEELAGYSLSPQQQRIYTFQSELDELSATLVLVTPATADLDALERAVQSVLQAHLIFNTLYEQGEGMDMPVQLPQEELLWSWEVLANNTDQWPEVKTNIQQGAIAQVYARPASDGRYELKIAVPAIVADHWSLQLLYRQIVAAYQEQTLPSDEALQYVQFSEWQHQLLDAEEAVEGKLFWQNQSFAETNSFKLTLEQPARQFKPQTQAIVLSQDHIHKHTTNETIEATLATAWNILLWHLGAQQPHTLGHSFHFRDFEELHQTIGLFAKVLPLTPNLKGEDSLSDAVARCKAGIEEASGYKEYFINEHWGQSSSNTPSTFSYQFEYFEGVGSTSDFSIQEAYSFTELFKLKLLVRQQGDDVEAALHYNNQCFNQEAINFIQNAYVQVLDQVLEQPNLKVAEVTLLNEAWTQKVLEGFNQTQQIFNSTGLVEQLSNIVAQQPDHIAVIAEEQQLTYRTLHQQSDQLAAHLTETYLVKPGDRVGLMTGDNLYLMIGLWGIIKAGATYVPIDPANPQERTAFILEDSQVGLIVSEVAFEEQYVSFTGDKLLLDQWESQEVKGFESVKRSSDDSLYVIYTSGTTGKPKGVELSDGSVLNYLNWFTSTFEVTADDSSALMSSYAFDLGYTSLFGCLLKGATLHLVPDDLVKSPDNLVQYLVTHQVTFLKTTPSLFYLITQANNAQELHKSALRLMLLGGEMIRVEDIDRFLQWKADTAFVNHYGPTEATIGTIAHRIATDQIDEYRLDPVIGQSIANNQIYLLDEHNKPVAPGINGEICVSGAGLAKGYLNRPELTEEKFAAHPFKPGERIYRTGDLGQWLPNGTILFKGRKDEQVKIRGHRIEPGEISEVLLTHAAINEALVVPHKAAGFGLELAAYVVSDIEVSLDELREFLGKQLPDYMVPAYFVSIKQIPLTPNGKIDKKALPDPETNSMGVATSYEAPSNPIEEQVAEVWSKALNKESIGIHDDYFALGGDSIKAIQIVSRLFKAGYKAEIRDLFQQPTIAGFAAKVTAKAESAPTNGHQQAAPASEIATYPLSPMQEGMWFQAISEPDIPVNVVQRRFRIAGALDVEKIETTFNQLVERYDILRTRFRYHQLEQPVQEVLVHDSVDFAVIDLAHLDKETQEKQVEAMALKESDRGFDLANDAMIRVRLLNIGKQTFEVIWTYHHIIMDGWCFNLLVEDFFNIYSSLISNQSLTLEPIAPYRNYINWLQEKDKAISVAYWKEYLSGYETVAQVPVSHAIQRGVNYEPREYLFELNQELHEALQQWCTRHRVTQNTVIQAAWGALLARYNNTQDVVYGVSVSGRPADLPGVESMVGLFINTVPQRVRFDQETNFATLVKTLQEEHLESQMHHYVPLAEIQAQSSLQQKLLNNLLVFQNYPLAKEEASAALLKDTGYELDISYAGGFGQINYDFGLVVYPGEQMHFNFLYNKNLYEKAFVQSVAGHLETLLQALVDQSEKAIINQPILTAQETQQIVQTFNNTTADYPKDRGLVELFEEQVALHPKRTAVVTTDGTTCDYTLLNAQANRVALHLQQELGLIQGDLVGLLFEPSVEMITAIIGVLKAGCTYVPLDPEYPDERLQFILSDSQCKAVVSQSQLTGKLQDLYEKPIVNIGTLPEREGTLERTYHKEDLAYVIYTSGSTGKPKGCRLMHDNVVRLIINEHHDFDFNEEDIWLMTHSFAFDFSVWEIFGALLYGGQLVMPQRDEVRNPHALFQVAKDYRITVFNQTPGAFYAWANLALKHPEVYLDEHLRYIIFGGDRLEPGKLSEWAERYDPAKVQIINMYGITETTVHTTFGPMTKELINEPRFGSPIGVPLPETRVYICDPQHQLLPVGIPGEIYVGGTAVCAGYLNRPELNKLKFIPDPFHPGERLYRSGDVGRYLHDGTLEFLGRNDDQVQVRGFRVEPGEIAKALLTHEAIKEAIVAPVNDHGDVSLAAYWVPAHDTHPVATDLRKYAQLSLPDHLVPTHFVMLEQLPLTPNGKIDKKRLPDPLIGREQFFDSYEAPTNALEEQLVRIWQKELDLERIGINDSFFELGGHSLKAVRTIANIQDQLGFEVPVLQLFQEPTIKQLAAFIGNTDRDQADQVEGVYAPLTKGDKFPIFFFPPAIGYSFGFAGLARELDGHPVYGFNFIESRDPIPEYVKWVQELQPEGDLVFAGFSSGGSLAFNVAKGLEAEGRTVSDILFLDCRRKPDPEPLTPDEVEHVVDHYLSDPRAQEYLTSDYLRAKMGQKIRRSTKFIHQLTDHGEINANLHLVLSDDSKEDQGRGALWQEVTQGKVHEYQGIGAHVDMLDAEYIEHNAQLFRNILQGIESPA